MKKTILILSLFVAIFASCKKQGDTFDAAAQAAKDETAIQAYLKANPSITATKNDSGLYYQVLTEGTGTSPIVTSSVTVNYTGKLLNGSVFAQPANLTSQLSNLIKGWQVGIPKIKKGGRILLIIPSALGYGNQSPGTAIPANSVLVFTIDLLSFN